MKTLARYTILITSILLYGWLFYSDFCGETLDEDRPSSILEGSNYFADEEKTRTKDGPTECSMESCFDFSKCESDMKVYVYPDIADVPLSEVYFKILSAIRESRYVVSDPREACLFIVSVDTIDRDRISENYVRDVEQFIRNLPASVWNNGANHIIFNLYHGTYPDYSDHNLGFASEKAIIARASPSLQNYRFDFDVSFPLFHKEHPLRSIMEVRYDKLILDRRVIMDKQGGRLWINLGRNFSLKVGNRWVTDEVLNGLEMEHDISLKTKDQYIVSFKGKRYVYGECVTILFIGRCCPSFSTVLISGIGSETRDSLHHLHNGETVVMVTTCKHNSDWKAHQDSRCESDNAAYVAWDYETMMANSTFCLTPRGRRLGSFRFLEALRLGCIPVVLSDDWVLPFDEILDWSAAAVIVPEDNVLTTPDILYTYSAEKIFQMKQQGFYYYHRYFSSVEKIVITALEIVWERVRMSRALSRYRWSHLHPFDASMVGNGVVLVIKATNKPSSRLQRTVSSIAAMDGLIKVVILWPQKRGVPPIGADFGVKTPLEFIRISDSGLDAGGLHSAVGNGFVVFMDERVSATLADLLTLLDYLHRNPFRLIGVHGIEFDWQRELVVLGRVYNALTFSLVVFHSWYLGEHISPIPRQLWNECLSSVINIVVAERSMLPPMVVGEKMTESWMNFEREAFCYRKLAARWQSGLPLFYSDLRFV